MPLGGVQRRPRASFCAESRYGAERTWFLNQYTTKKLLLLLA